jgi:transcriptional antiterminator RfaH
MYWAAAQLQPQRERLALHCLALAGFEIYQPRLRERRLRNGRRVEVQPLLFPGYCFLSIELQWRAAHYCPGVIRLVMDGLQPAKVPDVVIDEIRARERNGVVHLPERELRRGDAVRVVGGALRGLAGLYDGQPAPERVAVLLGLFGSSRRVVLAERHIERVE